MRSFVRIVVLAGASSLAAAATNACAEVSASWAAQIQSTPTPTVAAVLAHQCLESVPLGKDAAIELLDAIEPYLEWQSDDAYLKDPPKDYFFPAVDIFGNLAKVRENLVADVYDSEYAFQNDLYQTVFAPAHDGHFLMYPDALARAFAWRRQRSLVSISEDGRSLPVIKIYEDVVANPETALAVVEINGIEASKYVQDTMNKATFNQDADAAYNTAFFEKALSASTGLTGYFKGGGRNGIIYQGPNTTFTFEDGSIETFENEAAIVGNMTDVIDGETFYKRFCTPRDPAPASPAKPGNFQVPGYPKPVIATQDGIVSGYYLSGKGLDNVAVISLLAFQSQSTAEFHAVVRDFFAEAKAAGKTKLVIDFQGNAGGYILLGYDFFRQLFPQVQEDGFSRWRGNDGFIAISDIVSKAVKDLDPFTSDDGLLINLWESWFNYRYDLNLTLDHFEAFEDKFAPHVYKDTPYTALMRWDLNDPLTTVNSTYGLGTYVAGYGPLQNLTQPFEAEDIIILYDGFCASTCTIASEMLRIQGGVKSIAMGGRPQEGPIQGIGGVKGSQILYFRDILAYAEAAANLTDVPEQLAELSRYTSLPHRRSTAAAANVRDQILRDNVNDGLPAQFVVEEADCRLYWTAPMIDDVTEVWTAAANAAFNGAKCAFGAIPSSQRTTSTKGPISKPPPRLSDRINRTPDVHSDAWLAVHLQKAI